MEIQRDGEMVRVAHLSSCDGGEMVAASLSSEMQVAMVGDGVGDGVGEFS